MQEIHRVRLSDEDQDCGVRTGDLFRVEQTRGVEIETLDLGEELVECDSWGKGVDLDGSVGVLVGGRGHVAESVLEDPEVGGGFGVDEVRTAQDGVEFFLFVVEDARSFDCPLDFAVPCFSWTLFAHGEVCAECGVEKG